jgi:hypothetical protein
VDAQNTGKFTTEPRRHRGKSRKTGAERLTNLNRRGTEWEQRLKTTNVEYEIKEATEGKTF